MKKLRVKLTRRGNLRLKRGRKIFTIRGLRELEIVGHTALDTAVVARDLRTATK